MSSGENKISCSLGPDCPHLNIPEHAQALCHQAASEVQGEAALEDGTPDEDAESPTADTRCKTCGAHNVNDLPEDVCTMEGCLREVAEHPKCALRIHMLAMFYQDTGDLENAHRCHREAAENCDLDPSILSTYAHFLDSAVGDTTSAEVNYRKALRGNPADERVLKNFAGFLRREGRLAEAGQIFERLLELRPDCPVVLGNYARMLFLNLNDYEKAAEYFRKSLVIRPNSNFANVYGYLLSMMERYSEAKEQLEIAIALDPSNGQAYQNLADLYKRHKNMEVAIRLLQIGVQNSGRQEDTLVLKKALGALYGETGDIVSAVECYSEVIKEDHSDMDARFDLAWLLHDVGGPQEFIEPLYESVIEACPDNVNYRIRYGEYLENVVQDNARTREYYEGCLSELPACTPLRRNFAAFLMDSGLDDEGRQHLNVALQIENGRTGNAA